MKTKLITALRTTAKAIESGLFPYDWKKQSRCNCGALVSCLLGVSPVELARQYFKLEGSGGACWSNLAGMHCPVTGIPTVTIFKTLFEAGLTIEDIKNLEFLADPAVVARLPQKTQRVAEKRFLRPAQVKTVEVARHYDSKEDVVEYMRAWADLLQEQGREDVVADNAGSVLRTAGADEDGPGGRQGAPGAELQNAVNAEF